nr:hypothetical protein Itr_chr14CG12880 [Ipomoea trifida]
MVKSIMHPAKRSGEPELMKELDPPPDSNDRNLGRSELMFHSITESTSHEQSIWPWRTPPPPCCSQCSSPSSPAARVK